MFIKNVMHIPPALWRSLKSIKLGPDVYFSTYRSFVSPYNQNTKKQNCYQPTSIPNQHLYKNQVEEMSAI